MLNLTKVFFIPWTGEVEVEVGLDAESDEVGDRGLEDSGFGVFSSS